VDQNKIKSLYSWLASEHSRLHIVAGWPESTRKQALLTAIRSSIRQLTNDPQAASFSCLICRPVRPMTMPGSRPWKPVTDFSRRAA
jgi:hypothetical protein